MINKVVLIAPNTSHVRAQENTFSGNLISGNLILGIVTLGKDISGNVIFGMG